MVSILDGGLPEFTKCLRQYANISRRNKRELKIKNTEEIDELFSRYIWGEDIFERNGTFSKIGEKKLKKMLFNLALEKDASVNDYIKRVQLFKKNPNIKYRLESLRNITKLLYENPKTLKGLKRSIYEAIMNSWNEQALLQNFLKKESFDSCISFIKNPLK